MRTQGTVKWFDDVKGYGFIRPTDGTADVFVHRTGIADTGAPGKKVLHDGQSVEFDRVDTKKGPQAENVVAL